VESASVIDPEGFALMAATVTPAWTPDGVRVGLPAHEAKRWTDSVTWLTAAVIERLGMP
jgi:hypothetical protein